MVDDRNVGSMFKGTLPQLLAVLSGTCCAIADGMQYGWSAPYVPRLQAPDSPFLVSDNDVTMLETLLMMGGIVGLPLTIYAVDKIGRKKSILIASSINLIGWVLIGIATNVYYLFVARTLSGLAADVSFVAAPMYVAEIADQKIRGFLASLIYLMMLFGLLLVYCIGPFTPFFVAPCVAGLVLVTQLITLPFMPSSPYFLMSKGKVQEARKALSRLRKYCDVEDELSEIQAVVEEEKSHCGRPQDLILIPSNRKAIIIMTYLNGAQHFGGYSVIMMNLHSILTASGSIYMSSEAAAILFAALMTSAAAIVCFFMDRYGRKFLLMTSAASTGCCLLLLAIYFNLQEDGYDVTSASWIPIVSCMVYAVTLKLGLGMVPIVLTAELFPTSVKAIGMTVSDFMYIFFATISIFVYQNISKSLGLHVPFYIFAATTFLTVFFTFFYIPETKGRSLEEIQYILKGKNYEALTRQYGTIEKTGVDSCSVKMKLVSSLDSYQIRREFGNHALPTTTNSVTVQSYK